MKVCPVCEANGITGHGTQQTFVVPGMREGLCGKHYDAWLNMKERKTAEPRERQEGNA